MNKICRPRSLYGIFFFLFLTNSLFSQENEQKHFLWRIQSTTNTVYLLGSIHASDERLYPMPLVIDDAFQQSDILGLEIDMSKTSPADILKSAVYTDGRTLDKVLKPEVFQMLEKEYSKLKVTKEFFNKMKPWVAVMTLQSIEMMKKGMTGSLGVDTHYMNQAIEKNKKIIELESVDLQMKVFDKFLDTLQNEFVEYSLKSMDSTDDKIDEMLDIWKSGNLEKLENLVFSEFKDIPNYESFLELFLYSRNNNMKIKLEEILQDNHKYFIIVGAAHLIGEKGIINSLHKTGKYKIERL